MENDFEQITKNLEQRELDIKQYQEYLGYILRTDFEKFVLTLEKRNVPLQDFYDFLEFHISQSVDSNKNMNPKAPLKTLAFKIIFMEMDFDKLVEQLQKRNVNLNDFLNYLHYHIHTDFQQILASFRKRTISIQAYYESLTAYLKNRPASLLPLPSPKVTPPPSNLPQPQTSPQPPPKGDSPPSSLSQIQSLGFRLLCSGKINIGELNELIQEIALPALTTRKLLQRLLKQRKIQIEEFLEWDQENIIVDLPEHPYKMRLQKGKLEFHLDMKSQTKQYGPYQILEEIARGGMGVVYKVYHPGINQTFALKVLISGKTVSENTLKRFQREIRTLARLKHSGLIQYIDQGVVEDEQYLVMEYAQGETLAEKIKKGLSVRESLSMIRKCLEALDFAHQNGLIHRDLKPENIFITEQNEPRIGDFGLAKDTILDKDATQLTKIGLIIGTPAYMPPEQAMGATDLIDSLSDIYSMGVCLYQALTGQLPYSGASMKDLLIKILKEKPLPPTKLVPTLHPDIDLLVMKALEKQKKNRYASAKEFAEAIERFLEGKILLSPKARVSRKNTFPLEKSKLAKFQKLVLVLVSFLVLMNLFLWRYYASFSEAQVLYQEFQSNQSLYFTLLQSEHPETHRKKLCYLLDNFYRLQHLLSLKFKENELKQEIKKTIEDLIFYTCLLKEFALAEIILDSIPEDSWLSSEETKHFQVQIVQEKSKHQVRIK